MTFRIKQSEARVRGENQWDWEAKKWERSLQKEVRGPTRQAVNGKQGKLNSQRKKWEYQTTNDWGNTEKR